MSRNVIKMLGCAELCRVLATQIHSAFFDEFDETVQLCRHQEGIDRIAEHDQIGFFQRCYPHTVIIFHLSNLLANVQNLIVMLRKMLLNKQHGIQRDAVFPRGGTVQYKNVHSAFLLFCPVITAY